MELVKSGPKLLTKILLFVLSTTFSLILVGSFGSLPVFAAMFADFEYKLSGFTLFVFQSRGLFLAVGVLTAIFSYRIIFCKAFFSRFRLAILTVLVVQMVFLAMLFTALLVPISQLGSTKGV